MTDTDKTAEAVLDAAIALVRQGWTQWAYARDADGKGVGALDPAACQWCLSGAVQRAVKDTARGAAGSFFASWEAIWAAKADAGDDLLMITEWNDADGRTADEVVAMLERAKRHA